METLLREKICSHCKQSKLITEFGIDLSKKDGHKYHCLSCDKKSDERRRRVRGIEARKKPLRLDGKKECLNCGMIKDFGSFDSCASKADGLAVHCKTCRRLADYDRHFERYFGISLEDRTALLIQQNWQCAICFIDFIDSSKVSEYLYNNIHPIDWEWQVKPLIDHDHACCPQRYKQCGQCVRGILCQHCNSGLGFLKDNKRIIHSALDYLDKREIHLEQVDKGGWC